MPEEQPNQGQKTPIDEAHRHEVTARAQNTSGSLIRASVEYRESGPLPSPFFLERYEKLVPGSAARIMEEAFEQSAHRREIEKSVVSGDNQRANWGLASGFIASILSLGVSAFAVAHGADWIGSIVGGGTIASLAYTFIYGTRARKDERIGRAKIMAHLQDPPHKSY